MPQIADTEQDSFNQDQLNQVAGWIRAMDEEETEEELLSKILFAATVHPNYKNKEGFNFLHLLSLNGEAKLASLFLENGPGVDERDGCGQTPLHCAAMSGNLAFLEFLIKYSAGPNVTKLNL